MDTSAAQQIKQQALMDALISQRDSALNAVCNLQADTAIYKARIQELEAQYTDIMGKYMNAVADRDKYKSLIESTEPTAEEETGAAPVTAEAQSPTVQEQDQDTGWEEASQSKHSHQPQHRSSKKHKR